MSVIAMLLWPPAEFPVANARPSATTTACPYASQEAPRVPDMPRTTVPVWTAALACSLRPRIRDS